jgi:hypothetical protein
MYKYFSTQRPISIGTFPKSTDNRVIAIENFNNRKYVDEIGREAWGLIKYEKPLSDKQINEYELVKAKGE